MASTIVNAAVYANSDSATPIVCVNVERIPSRTFCDLRYYAHDSRSQVIGDL